MPDDGKLTMCVMPSVVVGCCLRIDLARRLRPQTNFSLYSLVRDRAAQFVGIGKQHSLDPAILDGAQLFCPFYTPPCFAYSGLPSLCISFDSCKTRPDAESSTDQNEERCWQYHQQQQWQETDDKDGIHRCGSGLRPQCCRIYGCCHQVLVIFGGRDGSLPSDFCGGGSFLGLC